MTEHASTSDGTFRIFVASPGDVVDERAQLERVVAEFNHVHRQERGIHIELIQWKTHTNPGVGRRSERRRHHRRLARGVQLEDLLEAVDEAAAREAPGSV
jgi:hypothetical protein